MVPLPDAETAELTKIAECVYRDVNIAWPTSYRRYAHDADIEIDRVIEARTPSLSRSCISLGAGVGGHCIPVYPYFLLAGRDDLPITALAREVNDSMPAWSSPRSASGSVELAAAEVLVSASPPGQRA